MFPSASETLCSSDRRCAGLNALLNMHVGSHAAHPCGRAEQRREIPVDSLFRYIARDGGEI